MCQERNKKRKRGKEKSCPSLFLYALTYLHMRLMDSPELFVGIDAGERKGTLLVLG